MKKLLEKDKVYRKKIKTFEKKRFILQTISSNNSLLNLIRLKALNSLNKLPATSSKTVVSNRCVLTINKKKINKLTHFSRHVFRKLVLKKEIYGIHK